MNLLSSVSFLTFTVDPPPLIQRILLIYWKKHFKVH